MRFGVLDYQGACLGPPLAPPLLPKASDPVSHAWLVPTACGTETTRVPALQNSQPLPSQ